MQTFIGPMRLPFIILTPACVAAGIGAAVWQTGSVIPATAGINSLYLILALLGAIASHISVNSLNEYFDFKSGLDFITRKTPFSGGSGTLPANPGKANLALATGLTTLGIAAVIGVYFLSVRGLALLPLGLLGLLVVASYTVWLTRSPWLCLVAPGLGFGTFMVMGTYFVLTGGYSWSAFFASLVPFFLVNNLLLLNQFPDLEADRAIGRRHLVIIAGRPRAARVYAGFLVAYLSLVVGVALGYLPAFALLGLLTLPLAAKAALNALRNPDDLEKLMPSLGLNVILNILTPLLVAVGLLIA
ncbi:MAG: prenyltransferase [Anaerolineaceae bacterium]|nr:prenyltransferase [Anaerolineaceae bacterium]